MSPRLTHYVIRASQLIFLLFALALIFLPLLLHAELGPHPVERLRMGDTESAVLYKDKMSDGTWRDSQIVKPAAPAYPERITLSGTNDLPALWELVYVVTYEGGRVQTNSEFVVKTSPRDRLRTVPVIEDSPAPAEEAIVKTDALAQTKVMKMGKRQPRELSATIRGDKVEHTLSDGTVSVAPLRVAHTARVSAPLPDVQPPAGNKYNAKELAAFAAGVAAALAAYGIKRVV